MYSIGNDPLINSEIWFTLAYFYYYYKYIFFPLNIYFFVVWFWGEKYDLAIFVTGFVRLTKWMKANWHVIDFTAHNRVMYIVSGIRPPLFTVH